MPLALQPLEARRGVRLFPRSTRRLPLSQAGARSRNDCLRILDDLAELAPYALPVTELHAVHAAGRSPRRRLSAFLDFLEEHLTSSPPELRGAPARAAKGKPSRPGHA